MFWVNTLLNDFNLDSYAEQMKKDGRNPQDVLSLGAFAYIGLRNANRTGCTEVQGDRRFRESQAAEAVGGGVCVDLLCYHAGSELVRSRERQCLKI